MPELLQVPTWILLSALGVTLVAAALQGTIGLGFGIVSVPVIALLDPALSPVPQLLCVLPLTLGMAWREREAVRLKGALWVLLGRLPGLALGVLLLKAVGRGLLDLLMAAFVLGAVALLASGARLRRTPSTEFTAGIISGTSALVASIGGPPIALLYRDEKGPTLRATMAVIFAIGGVLTIVARILADEIRWVEVQMGLLMAPAVWIGLRLSDRLRHHVNGPRLKTGIFVVSALAAVALGARSLL